MEPINRDTELAFLACIAENHADKARWNAYIDWLEENGASVKAKYARKVMQWEWVEVVSNFRYSNPPSFVFQLRISDRYIYSEYYPQVGILDDGKTAVLFIGNDKTDCDTFPAAIALAYAHILKTPR